VLQVRNVPTLSRPKRKQTSGAKNLQERRGTKFLDSEYEENQDEMKQR
jgi:hypothetical protein